METEQIRRAAEAVIAWCTEYGYGILRYPDNLREYARKELPEDAQAAELVADAATLPGSVDCLMWCRYYAADVANLKACTESFVQLLRDAARPNTADLERAFRLLAQCAAGQS